MEKKDVMKIKELANELSSMINYSNGVAVEEANKQIKLLENRVVELSNKLTVKNEITEKEAFRIVALAEKRDGKARVERGLGKVLASKECGEAGELRKIKNNVDKLADSIGVERNEASRAYGDKLFIELDNSYKSLLEQNNELSRQLEQLKEIVINGFNSNDSKLESIINILELNKDETHSIIEAVCDNKLVRSQKGTVDIVAMRNRAYTNVSVLISNSGEYRTSEEAEKLFNKLCNNGKYVEPKVVNRYKEEREYTRNYVMFNLGLISKLIMVKDIKEEYVQLVNEAYSRYKEINKCKVISFR